MSVTPVNAVMLNGICMPGVVPLLGTRAAVNVTVSTVVVVLVFHEQVAFVPHVIVAVVPSWSWIEIVVAAAFIFSLKVTLNASPASTKSELGPALLVRRASTIVGGVKSAAPVTNVVHGLQFARSLPAMSWTSFATEDV